MIIAKERNSSLLGSLAKRPGHIARGLIPVLSTATTLGVRLFLTDELRGRPTLIVFTLPIILSAYLGGLGAGLLATALCYLGASFFLLPPFNSFRVTHIVDRWDLFFLVLAGVVISVLNEAL